MSVGRPKGFRYACATGDPGFFTCSLEERANRKSHGTVYQVGE